MQAVHFCVQCLQIVARWADFLPWSRAVLVDALAR